MVRLGALPSEFGPVARNWRYWVVLDCRWGPRMEPPLPCHHFQLLTYLLGLDWMMLVSVFGYSPYQRVAVQGSIWKWDMPVGCFLSLE
ncbi:hypothetical protein JAAARDRAFT_320974 [Jaapia argillacea MUCL 33604]|uniref:Uncharacterized protein n=1 Tax=Jaapia argillacea MUCL 33604 TaxID=933084 RepID=A0A067Q0H0_9AGAM|nr:hypothetical protein JAAARDRAFT_320974 [Jaapia argillacea MUCL 33604]